jgi:hypothetical protein
MTIISLRRSVPPRKVASLPGFHGLETSATLSLHTVFCDLRPSRSHPPVTWLRKPLSKVRCSLFRWFVR